MRLLGAKEFLKTVKPGTLCVEFWEDCEEQCLEIIKDFQRGENIIQKYGGEFYIFGDNYGSLSFADTDYKEEVEINNNRYDCLFYYDKNILGDACPQNTLQLVFENEDEYPNKIQIEYSNKFLTKNDIINIRDWFVKNHLFRSPDNWVWKHLDSDYKDNFIVNFKSEEV